MSTSSSIQPFFFQESESVKREIRTVIVDGAPLFVAKDVAATLGYTNTNKAVGDHCKNGKSVLFSNTELERIESFDQKFTPCCNSLTN